MESARLKENESDKLETTPGGHQENRLIHSAREIKVHRVDDTKKEFQVRRFRYKSTPQYLD